MMVRPRMKAARPGLAKVGIFLYYLPAYSPELNRIEPVFKQVKHHDMPTRSFTTRDDLRKAVEFHRIDGRNKVALMGVHGAAFGRG